MTFAPQSLLAARAYLQAHTGLPAASLGIVGDVAHIASRSSYHLGTPDLSMSSYSMTESPRDAHPTGAAAALDIGSGWPRWRELTLWLVDQCGANAPDTQDIREIIYTPDGSTVRRWDRLGRRSTGDSSHLKHTHLSYFRDSEARDKTGLFRRFFEGDMAINETDLSVAEWRVEAMARGHDTVVGGPTAGEEVWTTKTLKEIKTMVDELQSRPAVDLSPAQLGQLADLLVAALPGVVEGIVDRIKLSVPPA